VPGDEESNQQGSMTRNADEFIRRLLMGMLSAAYVVDDRFGIPLTEQERRRLLLIRGACYGMLLAYMGVLLVNAVAIVACFLGVATGRLTLDWKYLASWAGGTTGLGAGSLLFKSVLDYLFATGRGQPHVAKSSGAPPKNAPVRKS
jgi:hypothetical protein